MTGPYRYPDSQDPIATTYATRSEAARLLADTVLDAGEDDLRAMMDALRDELKRRALARHIASTLRAGMAAASSFMSGVTHAATCRAFLRHSRGHKPFASYTNGTYCTAMDIATHEPCQHEVHIESGGSPQHGRMWTAADGAQAERHTRWWSPNEFVGGRTSVSPLTLSAQANGVLLRAYGYPWPTAAEPKNVVIGERSAEQPKYGLKPALLPAGLPGTLKTPTHLMF